MVGKCLCGQRCHRILLSGLLRKLLGNKICWDNFFSTGRSSVSKQPLLFVAHIVSQHTVFFFLGFSHLPFITSRQNQRLYLPRLRRELHQFSNYTSICVQSLSITQQSTGHLLFLLQRQLPVLSRKSSSLPSYHSPPLTIMLLIIAVSFAEVISRIGNDVFERLFLLTRRTDDHIRAERGVGNIFTNAGTMEMIPFAIVSTAIFAQ